MRWGERDWSNWIEVELSNWSIMVVFGVWGEEENVDYYSLEGVRVFRIEI